MARTPGAKNKKTNMTKVGGLLLPNEAAERYFNVETFERVIEDMRADRNGRERAMVTQDGLQVELTRGGRITYHARYPQQDGRWTTIRLGHHPEMTLDRAKRLTETIQYLADELGIDPKAALHQKLIREIEERGTKWRP